MTPRLRAEQAAARIYGLLIERALRTNTGPVTVGDLADLLTREFEAAAAPLPSESEGAVPRCGCGQPLASDLEPCPECSAAPRSSEEPRSEETRLCDWCRKPTKETWMSIDGAMKCWDCATDGTVRGRGGEGTR